MKEFFLNAVLFVLLLLAFAMIAIFIEVTLFADSIFCLIKGNREDVVYESIYVWLVAAIVCLVAYPLLLAPWILATLMAAVFVHYTDTLTNHSLFS